MVDKEIERKTSVKAEEGNDKKIYTFDEAIDLTGTGWYNIGLTATTSLCLLAMCIDMFSFSAVIPLCTCDFNLNMMQKSILLSMPFTGPVLTAYAWGYFADTRGRKLSLVLGMFVSFIMSTLCAFSPNWIVLALLKFISTCFCSCAQSATFALLGESCPEKTKGKLLLIMSSVVHLGMVVYFSISYLIGYLSFSYNLGMITFVPWRLLVMIYALPLGFGTISLMFFYESPKFLLNADRDEKALAILRRIHQRNGQKDVFVVEKMVLNEEGNIKNKNVPLLRSLMDQTLPLLKPPLLSRTLLMYYLIFVVFAVTGGYYIWLPFIAQAFTGGDSNTDFSYGLCSTITQNNHIDDSKSMTDECRSIDLILVIATAISGSSYSILNVIQICYKETDIIDYNLCICGFIMFPCDRYTQQRRRVSISWSSVT